MLEVTNLSAVFGSFALKGISFRAEAGDYTVLLGPCGAGKTKLLETITGVAPTTSGIVSVGEIDVTELAPENRGIGMIYQAGYLFPHLSVKDNIAFGLRYAELTAAEKQERLRWITGLLDLRHLMRRRSVINLSGGEQQKIILARTLVLQPQLLLMDEPFASLDFSTREELFSIFKILQRNHDMTIIHVTHDREEASVLSDRVLFLWNGRLLQQSSFDDLVTSPSSYEAVKFLGLKSIIAGTVSSGSFSASGCDRAGGGNQAEASVQIEASGPFTIPAPGQTDGDIFVYIPADAVTLSPVDSDPASSDAASSDAAVSDEETPTAEGGSCTAIGELRLLLRREGQTLAEVSLGKQVLGAILSWDQAERFHIGDQVRCRIDTSRITFLEESS